MAKFRRVSKDLHDRCLGTCREHEDKLSETDMRLLSEVASGWAGNLTVTKEKFDTARAILARVKADEG